MLMTNAKRIGLVLSGGAVRGIAHLGVLQAMEEAGIKPDVISGVSAGAIAAAFYADGYAPYEILDLFASQRMRDFIRPALSKGGFLKTGGLLKFMNKYLRHQRVEDLNVPVFLTVSNLTTGRAEYHHQGNLLRLVLASSAIPVLFRPVAVNACLCVDGGLLDNMPWRPIADQCDFLIGANVNPLSDDVDMKSMRSIAERCFFVLMHNQVAEHAHRFDILIQPPELAHVSLFQLKKARFIFDAGYVAMKKAIDAYR